MGFGMGFEQFSRYHPKRYGIFLIPLDILYINYRILRLSRIKQTSLVIGL